MSIRKQYRVNTPHVVSESFDDEVILVNLTTCVYYSLNETGKEIWSMLEAGLDIGSVAEQLAGRYTNGSQSIPEAVDQLIGKLRGEELIVEANVETDGSSPPAPVEEAVEKPPFTTPELSRYTDMQDLLMLDPIHDVDETGWPKPRDASDSAPPAQHR